MSYIPFFKMKCGLCGGTGKVSASDEYRGKVVYVDKTCYFCGGSGYKLSRNKDHDIKITPID
jgi:DnaJ-class molecular chaperone